MTVSLTRACRFLLVIAMFLLSVVRAGATHIMGADITYRCLGNQMYEFKLVLYRDCAGAGLGSTATLSFSSSSCGQSFSATLPQVGTAVEVSQVCPSYLSNTTCNGGSIPGTQQWTYLDTIQMPAQCSDWFISWTSCCRNDAITNLQSPGSQSMCHYATLNNTGSLCNNSPVYSSLPTPYICVNQAFCYNHGASEPDGDSLVYSSVAPQGTCGSPIPYVNPYGPSNPLATSSGFTINSSTGSMCFTPNAVQQAVIAILIEEYRNGTKIAEYVREMQVIVQSCSNQQPEDNCNGITNLTGAVQLGDYSVEACPGDSICWTMCYTDPDGDSVTISSNATLAVPGSSFSVSCTSCTGPEATFCWVPTGQDTGLHIFVVLAEDDGCPITGTQYFTFTINVLSGTTAGEDQYYCPGGLAPTLNAYGGSVFTWSVISGPPMNVPGNFSCNPCSSPQAYPSATTTYVVTSNLSASCDSTDTVTVYVVPSFTLEVSPDTVSICANEITQLSASATPSSNGPYTYSWTPSYGLSCTDCASPYASPLTSTPYYCYVTSSDGCLNVDTAVVIVTGVGPTVVAGPDTSICSGDAVQLSSTAFIQPLACGLATDPCSGSGVTGDVGNGGTHTYSVSPFHGFSWNSQQFGLRHQFLITASELQAAGIGYGGTIEQIGLNLAVANQGTFEGFTIKMGCTSLTSMPWNFVSGLSTVYGPVNHTTPSATGWHTIQLTTPYEWDGSSNLIVEFCSDGSLDMIDCNVYYTVTSFASTTYYYDEYWGGGGCGELGGWITNLRPNLRFDMCLQELDNPTYSWTPSAGLSNPSIPNPVATPSSSVTYLLDVSDNGCTGSGAVTLTVGPNFSLASHADTSICFGDQLQLWTQPSAAGSYTYSWSPAFGLSNPNVANPMCNPGGSITYTVEVSNGQGCVRWDTISVMVTGMPVYATASKDSACVGDAVQLNVQATPVSCGLNLWGSTTSTDTGQIGTDTWFTALYGPFYGQAKVRRQFLFTADELSAAGLSAGTVNSLSWNVIDKYSTSAFEGFTIKMSCTQSEYVQSGSWLPVSDVVWGPTDYNTGAGWNTFSLDTPFDWDGESNIIIETCYDNSVSIGSDYTEYSLAGFNALMAAQSNTGNGCSLNPGSIYSYRANIKFGISYAEFPSNVTFSWTPSSGLSDTTIQNPVATINGFMAYTAAVTNPNSSGCPSTSTVVIRTDSTNWVNAGNDATVCQGDTVQLDADFHGPAAPVILPCGVNGSSCTQTTYQQTVGSGTGSSYVYGPFFGIMNDARYQYLIKASELKAAGIESGTITQLALNVITKYSTKDYKSLTIGIGCTNATSLTTTGGWLSVSTVYGPTNTTTNTGWNTFTLSSPFDWDGSSNLVVQICYNGGNGPNGSADGLDYVQFTGGFPYNSTMYNYTDANNQDGCALSPQYTNTGRPNFRFTVCPGTPAPFVYTWTPSSGLSCTNCPDPVASPSSTTTYHVHVEGGVCDVDDSVTITVNTLSNPITWTGTVDTDWFKKANWNNCQIPACGIDVIVPDSVPNFPIIGASGAVCRSATINGGGSVTVSSGYTWQVCGDYQNNGTLNAQANSTVEFMGSGGQSVSGSLSNASAFANFMVNKSSGTVTLSSTMLEMREDFITSSSTGIFNSSGNYLKLGGDFLNSSGSATFTNAGTTGVLEFNGSSPQLYSPGGTLYLNDVIMNHTSSGVTINADILLGASGELTLNQGVILTGSNRVIAENTDPAAVTPGNTGSYVQGNLRRYLSSTGSFDFPVGHAAKGYQRVNIEFTGPTSIGYLDARFDPWPSLPGALNQSECAITYDQQPLDNGYWTIHADTNAGTGTYTTTLYNLNYTNDMGPTWTVMRDPTNGGSGWDLVNGSCLPSTPQQVVRSNMSGFSLFATTQASNLLPVELLTFTGRATNVHNLLEWTTAMEFNTSHFVVEHSVDEMSFTDIAEVDAAGFSTTLLSYHAIHRDPPEGTNYYRLKQTDLDGSFKYSHIIGLDNQDPREVQVVDVFPNPTSGTLTIRLYSRIESVVTITVADNLGRSVLAEEAAIAEGENTYTLNMADFPTAVYSVRIHHHGEPTVVKKVVRN